MEGKKETTARSEAQYYEPEAVNLADVGPFSPTRIAIKFGPPPTLIVELKHQDSQRLFHHKVALHNLMGDMDPEEVAKKVTDKDAEAFAGVPEEQITRLVGLLIAQCPTPAGDGETKQEEGENVAAAAPPPPSPGGASAAEESDVLEESVLEESVVEEEYSEFVDEDEDEEAEQAAPPMPPAPPATTAATASASSTPGDGRPPLSTNSSSSGGGGGDDGADAAAEEGRSGDGGGGGGGGEGGGGGGAGGADLEESMLSEAPSTRLSTGEADSMQSGDIDDLLNDIASPGVDSSPGGGGGGGGGGYGYARGKSRDDDDDDDDSYSFAESSSNSAGLTGNLPASPAEVLSQAQEDEAGTRGAGGSSIGGGINIDLTAIDDLQRVDEDYLATVKDKMGEEFEKKVISKDDPDYVYDKQVEFGSPTESNDWDDDEDE
jgi:hypothetical protein